MYGNTTQTGVFKLFHQITHSLRRSPNIQLMLKDAVQTIGWGLELDRCIIMLRNDDEQDFEARVFRESAVPFLVLDPETHHIVQANRACSELLASGRKELKNVSLVEFVAESDIRRIREASSSVSSSDHLATVKGIVARSA